MYDDLNLDEEEELAQIGDIEFHEIMDTASESTNTTHKEVRRDKLNDCNMI